MFSRGSLGRSALAARPVLAGGAFVIEMEAKSTTVISAFGRLLRRLRVVAFSSSSNTPIDVTARLLLRHPFAALSSMAFGPTARMGFALLHIGSPDRLMTMSPERRDMAMPAPSRDMTIPPDEDDDMPTDSRGMP